MTFTTGGIDLEAAPTDVTDASDHQVTSASNVYSVATDRTIDSLMSQYKKRKQVSRPIPASRAP